MRRLIELSLMLALLSPIALADERKDQPATAAINVPDGVRIPVVLRTSISAKSPVGTKVEMETTADIVTSERSVLIPKGAKILGHVTEAVRWSKEQPESRLSLVAEIAEWKNHTAAMRAFVAGQLRAMADRGWAYGSGAIAAVQVVEGVSGINPGPMPGDPQPRFDLTI